MPDQDSWDRYHASVRIGEASPSALESCKGSLLSSSLTNRPGDPRDNTAQTEGDAPHKAEVIHLPTADSPIVRSLTSTLTGEIEGFRERTEESQEFLHAIDSTDTKAEYNVRLVSTAIRWVSDRFGSEAVRRISRASGVDEQELRKGKTWLSLEQFEIVLGMTRDLAQNDDEFIDACSYKLRESYGPIVFLLRAMTAQTLYEAGPKTLKHVCKVGRFEVVESSRSDIRVRYYTDKPESRLVCLSRQAANRQMPTLWNLPAAQIEDHACVAHGDPYCEYHIRWHQQIRSTPILGGALVGGLVGAGVMAIGTLTMPPVAVLATFGAVLGYIAELKKTNNANLQFNEDSNRSLRELTTGYAEAHEEILSMHQRQRNWNRALEKPILVSVAGSVVPERQRNWNRALEKRVEERTSGLQEIVELAEVMRQRSETELRSVSHDLRSPLSVLRVARMEMAELIAPEDTDRRELLQDVDVALRDMNRLIVGLLEQASTDNHLIRLQPITIEVRPYGDRLRRRLRAMVHDRDIRASVFCSREAPTTVEADELLFDRVVDNLLTNAVKYTPQGSIVVELTGKPGMLTVKVLDTGPGISDEHIEMVFKAGETGQDEDVTGSYGFGLAIVVRLLDQIGGQLEVMSKPNVGTTFWAHFPVRLPEAIESGRDERLDDIIDRVVTIRRTAIS